MAGCRALANDAESRSLRPVFAGGGIATGPHATPGALTLPRVVRAAPARRRGSWRGRADLRAQLAAAAGWSHGRRILVALARSMRTYGRVTPLLRRTLRRGSFNLNWMDARGDATSSGTALLRRRQSSASRRSSQQTAGGMHDRRGSSARVGQERHARQARLAAQRILPEAGAHGASCDAHAARQSLCNHSITSQTLSLCVRAGVG